VADKKRWLAILSLGLVVLAQGAAAQTRANRENPQGGETVHHDRLFDSGKLLATGGVSQVEGAGGGGLATWALITGYETEDGIGANAHYTYVHLSDFALQTGGVAIGLFDRLELSYARQAFDTRQAGAKLGLGAGYTFHQDIYGAKLRLIGDAVFDQDRWLPQIAAGVQYKKNDRDAIIHAVGGKSSGGADYYIGATKIFLAERLVFNAVLRETKANQFGILGFGGDKHGGYSTQFEGTAAFLVNRQLVAGADFRTKPDNLAFAKEQDGADFFLAYFLNKNLSVTLAYVRLGDIALQKNQNGVYLSLQSGF
jgi:hypothetical protein